MQADGPANALGDDERGPALLALAVLGAEFRESGHDVVVALFDAIAGAITRDESTLHWAASRPGRLRAAFSPLVRRPCDLPPTAPLHRIAGTKARACVLNA